MSSKLLGSSLAWVVVAVAGCGHSGGGGADPDARDVSDGADGAGGDADVTTPDARPFMPQDVTYPPSVIPYEEPQIGDGTTIQGGTPPAFAIEPAAIASNFNVDEWKRAVPASGAPVGEAKFRTHCNYSHIGAVDPIVFPGQTGKSHLHMFFGNTKTDQNSTYESLRTEGGSTCGGGPLNRSAYWFPAVMKDNAIGDGATMAVKPDYAVVYYTVDTAASQYLTRIPRGFAYVFGFNPSDPTGAKIQTELDAAPGTYVRITNGFLGWKCESSNGANADSPYPGSPLQPYLRNTDGTATLTCPTNERIGAALTGPTCWDGVNLTSPDGRSHVRQAVREGNTAKVVCPIGWWRLPSFELVIWFSHLGPDDYKEWYLSSDRMGDPSMWFANGASFHTDWFGAWDYDVMTEWMRHCNGIAIDGEAGDPHSCIDTSYGQLEGGIVSEPAPDGSRNPQVNLGQRYVDQGTARFEAIP